MGGLEGKVVLVTGGGAGIGRHSCLAFAARGARVVATDYNGSAAEAVAHDIRSSGGEAIGLRTDVTIEADVAASVAAGLERFGGIDCAFNNAGILGPVGIPLSELAEADWARTIAVNLTGVMLCMKHELNVMLPRGRGAIVNMSSATGLVAAPLNPAYGAAKHGVIGLTRSAAAAHARDGVRINAICPGTVQTDMITSLGAAHKAASGTFATPAPIGRLADPDEIAACVVWLCSDDASYVTGHALAADGGWTAT